MNSGSETVKGLRPSVITGIRSTTQETSRQIPRGQTSNVSRKTTPLTNSALVVTKHATVEPCTSIYQASSVANHWNSGRNSFRELISTPESKSTVNSLFHSTKPTATSAPINPSSSSVYQPTSHESPARQGEGIMYTLVMNIILNSLKYCLFSGIRFFQHIILSKVFHFCYIPVLYF